MKIESRLTERRTATAVTRTIRPKVGIAGISFQRACAAKKVKEDRDRRAVEGVRRHRVLPRRLQLADDEERDAGQEADRHPDGRRQPALGDGVAQERDRRHDEHDAGDPGEELDADEALPVERGRGGRRGGRGPPRRGDRRRGTRRDGGGRRGAGQVRRRLRRAGRRLRGERRENRRTVRRSRGKRRSLEKWRSRGKRRGRGQRRKGRHRLGVGRSGGRRSRGRRSFPRGPRPRQGAGRLPRATEQDGSPPAAVEPRAKETAPP